MEVKMPRFEMSVSPDYVPEWTEIDAFREIFQNAVDQSVSDDKCRMEWEYSHSSQTLIITNHNTSLLRESLLFGITAKKGDDNTIGTFGEGYKLALLVFARLGYEVSIWNYNEGEVWVPKIIRSRRFSSDLLVIDINDMNKEIAPSSGLSFVINGVTERLFKGIEKTNLHIKPVEDVIETHFGKILLKENYNGMVFVNGLYICTKPIFDFGYDIKPSFITTGRDRNLVADFDLSWITSRMWASSGDHTTVLQLIKRGTLDVVYINNFKHRDMALVDSVWTDFINQYGESAIPVRTQGDYDKVTRTYKALKPVFVNETLNDLMVDRVNDILAKAEKHRNTSSPDHKLNELYFKCRPYLPVKYRNEFKDLINESKEWEVVENA
jgi:hypothetical protein